MLDVYKIDIYINNLDKCGMAILLDTGIRNTGLYKIKRYRY